MKRLVSVILILALCLVTLAGCGSEGSSTDVTGPKELNVGMQYEPETVSPLLAYSVEALTIDDLIFDGLIREDQGDYVEGLAESWEVSEDGTTFTFHLRDANYTDGTPITSEDIKYFVLTSLDPMYESAHTIKLVGAEDFNLGKGKAEDVGIETPDDKTVIFHAQEPMFLSDFTSIRPLKQDFFEERGEQFGSSAEDIIGNGPYILTSWVHESEAVLEKNPDYWNAENIKLDKIRFVINAEGQTAVDLLMSGDLDLAEISDQDQLDQLASQENLTYDDAFSGYQFFNINLNGKTDETGKWLSNVNFRKALSYAMDREIIVGIIYSAFEPATRLTAPGEYGSGDKTFNEEFPYEGWSIKADADKAKEYMAKAMEELGVKDVSDIPTFTFLVNDSQKNMDFCNAISDMWNKALGINSVIDAQPISSMFDKSDNGDFDFWKGGESFGDPDWLVPMTDYWNEYYGYDKIPEFMELCDTARYSKTVEERKAAMFEIEKYYCDNMLNLVIAWDKAYAVHNKKVTGLTRNSYMFNYIHCDIEE